LKKEGDYQQEDLRNYTIENGEQRSNKAVKKQEYMENIINRFI